MKSQSQDNVRKASREKTSCFRDCVPSPLHYYDLSARPLCFLSFSLQWDPGGASSSPRSIEQDINSCIVSVSIVGCWYGDILTLQTKVCMLSIPQPATTCPEPMSSIVDRTSLDGGHWVTPRDLTCRVLVRMQWPWNACANNIHVHTLEVQPPFSKCRLMFLSGVFIIIQKAQIILTGY